MTIWRTLRNALLASALVATAFIAAPATAHAGVFVSVAVPPPAIPVYAQPEAPGDGYIWTPGYWAYGDNGYYWVDGAWVYAPYEGALWTPGYWGWGGGFYAWHPGYWGRSIGYYGDVNYGFGYFGIGFYGGYWRDHHFFYNREYSRIGGGFHNVYSQRFNTAGFGHQGFESRNSFNNHAGGGFHGASEHNFARQGSGHSNVS
jgi:WXXGXW repeat (2 copies)